jgi:hypothetical protein
MRGGAKHAEKRRLHASIEGLAALHWFVSRNSANALSPAAAGTSINHVHALQVHGSSRRSRI